MGITAIKVSTEAQALEDLSHLTGLRLSATYNRAIWAKPQNRIFH